MGCNFQYETVEAASEMELRSKYADIVAECEYDYGHAGYTGTFAEKHKLEIVVGINDDQVPEEYAYDHCIEHNQKWGPSSAYYLGNNKWFVGGWCSS